MSPRRNSLTSTVADVAATTAPPSARVAGNPISAPPTISAAATVRIAPRDQPRCRNIRI